VDRRPPPAREKHACDDAVLTLLGVDGSEYARISSISPARRFVTHAMVAESAAPIAVHRLERKSPPC
jgi:hypothetical protein